jgi:hypothetical protein
MEGDLAIAGMSLVKIPILVETYRALDRPPNEEQGKLISETMGILSGNATANWLLEEIAGAADPFAGADILNASLKELGIYNTFIAVPYDLDPREDRLPTFLTPANQRTDKTTFPDPFRQTTAADLGRLLEMIYSCAEHDDGVLRQVYGAQVTQDECRQMLDVMLRLELDALLEAGVPDGTPLAHKHGWIDDTNGDAGIVFTPGGDYVLVVALYEREWLEWEIAAPLIAEISRLAYVHFNDPQAYAGQPPLPAASPTAVGSPTPALPHAVVSQTGGVGLTIREQPGGKKIAIVAEGTILTLLESEPILGNGFEWRHVRLPDGKEGWTANTYLVDLQD